MRWLAARALHRRKVRKPHHAYISIIEPEASHPLLLFWLVGFWEGFAGSLLPEPISLTAGVVDVLELVFCNKGLAICLAKTDVVPRGCMGNAFVFCADWLALTPWPL